MNSKDSEPGGRPRSAGEGERLFYHQRGPVDAHLTTGRAKEDGGTVSKDSAECQATDYVAYNGASYARSVFAQALEPVGQDHGRTGLTLRHALVLLEELDRSTEVAS